MIFFLQPLEDHDNHLWKLFKKLKAHELCVKKENYESAQIEIMLLRQNTSKGLLRKEDTKGEGNLGLSFSKINFKIKIIPSAG